MSTSETANEAQNDDYHDQVAAEDCLYCCSSEDDDRITIYGDTCSEKHRKEILGVTS